MLPLTLASAALLVASATLPGGLASAATGVDPAAPPVGARALDPSPTWRAPVDPAVVLRSFDPPARRWLPGHRGVDLAAGLGDPVRAAGAGTITWAGPLAGRGVVVVMHDGGLRTTYEPVDPAVTEGDRVEAGVVLGVLGEGDVHCGHEPRCLHWGLRRGEDYLDPWRLLRPGRAVLLPP